MANKNKNRRRGPQPSASSTPPIPQRRDDKHASRFGGQGVRETVESLVIAFVLAFLFRTFQAEAFVIPTGSMAPTLMGRHEDLECPECGQRFRVSDSERDYQELERAAQMDRGGRSPQQIANAMGTVAGQCPNCRHTTPFKPLDGLRNADSIPEQPAYSGDRILVNKYAYSFADPSRWDIVVFKYPGNATRNYIKRLVGLPGEELRIQHGDIFTRTDGDDFEIVRKPADKILAMRQLVHDTDHDPVVLRQAGYPLRWSPADPDGSAWKVEEEVEEQVVRQTFQLKKSDQTEWLRYTHLPPGDDVWSAINRTTVTGAPAPLEPRRRLVSDYNAYNTDVSQQEYAKFRSLSIPSRDQGIHWVGDLILETRVNVQSETGELTLELVKAGCRFRCRFDVQTGKAMLSATLFGEKTPWEEFKPTAQTRLQGAGKHKLRFANVDDQLTLWVDGKVVEFDSPTSYDAARLFGSRDDMIPRTSDEEPGDFSPAAVGGQELTATISRLSLWRDIYYIADKSTRQEPSPNPGGYVSDFELMVNGRDTSVRTTSRGPVPVEDLLEDPSTWEVFRERRTKEFTLDDNLFFVMGDNSAASSDARLWAAGGDGVPGGPYLERKLLIGKAACVYWPHSYGKVPGTPIPFPFFPNFGDMRLVR